MAKKKTDDAAAEAAAKEETTEETTEVAAEVAPEAAAEGAPQAQPGQIQQQITINDGEVTAGYANFCRVSSTPEELILDLGLNPTPFASGEVTVNLSQRVIMNHITAKRMLGLLSATLQRHEQTFGVVETDVRRRVRPQG
ncbi:MAG: DUF3467 domain-containing protein [Planctomycetaceae bacterium]|nr:DUF3467 domain-containing protein [Planctomycetaceae bacterium]